MPFRSFLRKFSRLRHNAAVLAPDYGDCGPAALATMVRHYGGCLSVGEARDLLHTTLRGTTLANLKRGAEALGFLASPGRMPFDALDKIALPVIARLRGAGHGHYVVVHEVGSSNFVIADPQRGLVSIPRAEFQAQWTGYVMLMKPSPDFVPQALGNSPLRTLVIMAASERKALLFMLCLEIAAAGAGLGISYFVRIILDKVVPRSDLQLLTVFGLGALIVVAVKVVCTTIRERFTARFARRLGLSLTFGFVEHLLSLTMDFFERRQTGDIFSRLTDINQIRTTITGPFLFSAMDICLLLLSSAVLAWRSLSLTIVAISFGLVLVVASAVAVGPLIRRDREIRFISTELNARFIETIANMRVVKAFTAELKARDRLKEAFENLARSTLKRDLISSALTSAAELVTSSAAIALIWVGTVLVVRGQITAGQLMFFYSALGMFLSSAGRLAPCLASVQEATVGVERVHEVMRLEPEPGLIPFAPSPFASGEIECRDLEFSYGDSLALSKINLRIAAGEWVAILGETGSGKTTLAYLLGCLRTPSAGEVLIDGQMVEGLDKNSVRREVAIMFQEGGLIRGSIRENIAISNPNADLEEIRDAARLASLDKFVTSLPEGYDTDVGPLGGFLSSGQKQRIGIARALLRNPRVLILDEATCHLDVATEQSILTALQERRRGCTTILVTHRLNVALLANRIVVLDRGRITEMGTHRELMALRQRYYGLWEASPRPDREYAAVPATLQAMDCDTADRISV